jgi:hypothetical protein
VFREICIASGGGIWLDVSQLNIQPRRKYENEAK